MSEPVEALPFKISVLAFLHDTAGRLLMIRRAKAPNLGCWSPIGGKLEMPTGESPLECAQREIREESGLETSLCDLHLFGYVSEKAYEGRTHWLMFLVNCRKPLTALPPEIDEGPFAFFEREQIDALAIPETDRHLVWPWYDQHRDGFVALSAICGAQPADLQITVEQVIRPNVAFGSGKGA